MTLRPLDTRSCDSRASSSVPALTIAWHPNISRVGEIAPLVDLLKGDTAPLQRHAPIFFKPGSSVGSAIDSRLMSRAPVMWVASKGRGVELRRGPSDVEVEIDGAPFVGARLLGPADLASGVVVAVARRIVLVLHQVRFPVVRVPDLGLLGSGDVIEDVRRLILRVAPRSSLVLLRGESGTGKELVARAIHAESPRASGPLVDVNMGLLRPERAAAELFGHEKGAFTGASEPRPGAFRQAHGGTLFLDEIGFTGIEVQQSLLRALQDHRVQALGSSQSRLADVRLIGATDANLEQLRDEGRILGSFYNRLHASFTIALPPLRSRREDVGVLLAHFLKKALRASGGEARLDGEWLKARTVAEILASPLEGNVRTLEGLAETLAVTDGDPHEAVCAYLARARPPQPRGGSGERVAARAALLSKERLLTALERCGWNQSAAARSLNVSRQALGRRLDAEPDIRRVIEIPLSELVRGHEACGGDLQVLAKRLGLSAELLRRRVPSRD
jgi:two-component system nitrogen regulation response regulator GlnG